MMRALAIALLVCVTAPAIAQTPPLADPTNFIAAADVQAAVAKAQATIKPGQAQLNTPLLRAGIYAAQLEYRQAVTPASVHLAQAEFIQVVAGGGTFTIGGTLIGGKQTGTNLSGTGIEGGITRPVVPGDILLVPAGAAHSFASINGRLAAVTMKLPVTP